MSDVFSIFMPGHAHWEEVKRAEKMLLVDSRQGGTGPDPLDLDNGRMVLHDRTGSATEASTDIGNPYRMPTAQPGEQTPKSAADDITTMPPTTDSAE
ncbi:MAG: hypothetical protein WBL05_00670 [Brooklawnia sp.]|uniref:hypothetical protein n=1 Tax=Brooklawnia sp. TaxID=2699740 RepID=UPI003C710D2A